MTKNQKKRLARKSQYTIVSSIAMLAAGTLAVLSALGYNDDRTAETVLLLVGASLTLVGRGK